MTYPAAFIQYVAGLDVKLTTLRKEVLYIVWRLKKPLKAYEILDELLKIKSNATPPSVYRALDFFLSHGVVHKIESIQSYTVCTTPEKQGISELLMVCNDCHQVTEVYDVDLLTRMIGLASAHQFQVNQEAIEVKGHCNQCQHIPPNSMHKHT